MAIEFKFHRSLIFFPLSPILHKIVPEITPCLTQRTVILQTNNCCRQTVSRATRNLETGPDLSYEVLKRLKRCLITDKETTKIFEIGPGGWNLPFLSIVQLIQLWSFSIRHYCCLETIDLVSHLLLIVLCHLIKANCSMFDK